jgi:hypothetical protein
MQKIFILICFAIPVISWAQSREIPNILFDKADLLIFGRIINVDPDVIQDDVGTAYGVLAVSCTYSYDLKSKEKIRCAEDTLWGLTYLSTEKNRRTIHLKKGTNCFMFVKFNPQTDYTENRQLLLYNEKSIFLVNRNTKETIMKNIRSLQK